MTSLTIACIHYVYVFFFKQKTAYEMRISDWSSDVCSSDLARSYGSWATRSMYPFRTLTRCGVCSGISGAVRHAGPQYQNLVTSRPGSPITIAGIDRKSVV